MAQVYGQYLNDWTMLAQSVMAQGAAGGVGMDAWRAYAQPFAQMMGGAAQAAPLGGFVDPRAGAQGAVAPELSALMQLVAQAHMQKGNRERALRLLEQSLRLEPRYDVTVLAISRWHLEGGDISTSLSVLTDYLTINPESAGACQQASMILAQLGMNEQARGMGEHAVRLLEKDSLNIEARQLRETLTALSGA